VIGLANVPFLVYRYVLLGVGARFLLQSFRRASRASASRQKGFPRQSLTQFRAINHMTLVSSARL